MWLTFAALLLGADVAPADVFKQMEQTVQKASSLQGKVAIVGMEGDKKLLDITGRFVVTTGDKVRMDVAGDVVGRKGSIVMISDGKKMSMASNGRTQEQDTIKKMTEIVKATYTRAGIFVGIFSIRPSEPDVKEVFDADNDLPVKDFKLGKKEKIGDRDTQVLEYTCTPKGNKEAIAITVWIDTKTNLPVKRVILQKEGSMTMTITETYSDLAIGGKVDDKDFILGK